MCSDLFGATASVYPPLLDLLDPPVFGQASTTLNCQPYIPLLNR